MFIIHLSQSGEGQLDLLNTVCRLAKDINRCLPIARFCSNTCLSLTAGKRAISQTSGLGSLGLRFRPCLGLELGLRQEAHSSRCIGVQGGGSVVGQSVQTAHTRALVCPTGITLGISGYSSSHA